MTWYVHCCEDWWIGPHSWTAKGTIFLLDADSVTSALSQVYGIIERHALCGELALYDGADRLIKEGKWYEWDRP